MAGKRGLTQSEMAAVEADSGRGVLSIPRAQVSLEMKPLILPPEHILKRDSEALGYAYITSRTGREWTGP